MSATIISGYRVVTRGSDKHVTFRSDQKREAIILAKRLSAKYSRTFTVQTVRETVTLCDCGCNRPTNVECGTIEWLAQQNEWCYECSLHILPEDNHEHIEAHDLDSNGRRFDTSDVCA